MTKKSKPKIFVKIGFGSPFGVPAIYVTNHNVFPDSALRIYLCNVGIKKLE